MHIIHLFLGNDVVDNFFVFCKINAFLFGSIGNYFTHTLFYKGNGSTLYKFAPFLS